MKSQLDEKISKYSLNLNREQRENLEMISYQIYMQNPNIEKETVVEATLYLCNLCKQKYSHHKIREVVDNLQYIPCFVSLDCYRSTCER